MGWGELTKNLKPRWFRIGAVIAFFTFSAFLESRRDEQRIDRVLISAMATHEKLLSIPATENGLKEYKNEVHLHAEESFIEKVLRNWVFLFWCFLIVCYRDRIVLFFAKPADHVRNEKTSESEPTVSPISD